MRRVWILGFLVGTGCSKPTVTGQVVDALGAPVAEVSVSNRAGALCTTDNADDGTFELPCTSSDLVLVFAREGWWSVEVEVPASSADQRPIEPVRMVKKAPSLGLWRWQDGDYTTLGIPAQVRRTTGRGGNWRKHFLVREGLDAEKASVCSWPGAYPAAGRPPRRTARSGAADGQAHSCSASRHDRHLPNSKLHQLDFMLMFST